MKKILLAFLCSFGLAFFAQAHSQEVVDLNALLISAVQELGADATEEEVENAIQNVLASVDASPQQVVAALNNLANAGLVNQNVVSLVVNAVASDFGVTAATNANATPASAPSTPAPSVSPGSSFSGGGSGGSGSGYANGN